MKKQILFISGGDAFSKHEDFLNYLRNSDLRSLPATEPKKIWTETLLEDLGSEFELFKPTMPNKQNANYEEWKIWLERHLEFLREGVVLVGWSLGGMFLAKYLSEGSFPVKIKALYLLGAPCGSVLDDTGNDCGNFQFSPAVLQNLEKSVDNINIFHSKDDHVVPFEHALSYKSHLKSAKLVTFEDKNHFLIANFDHLINDIKGLG